MAKAHTFLPQVPHSKVNGTMIWGRASGERNGMMALFSRGSIGAIRRMAMGSSGGLMVTNTSANSKTTTNMVVVWWNTVMVDNILENSMMIRCMAKGNLFGLRAKAIKELMLEIWNMGMVEWSIPMALFMKGIGIWADPRKV